MSEFLDYNAHNGMRYDTEEDHEKITVHSSQDVEAFLDHMKLKRGLPEQPKDTLRHYCSIPTEVQVELYAKGLNIMRKGDLPAVLKEINTNYPHLKATRMHHEIKG